MTAALVERAEVARMLPHGASWIFVDRVLGCDPPTQIRTQTRIASDDPIVCAHFRDGPAILPGVVLVEMAGQSAYLLGRLSASASAGAPPAHLLARCSATFVSPARAGDVLTTEVRLVERVRDVSVYEASITADQRAVCRVRLFAAPAGVEVGPS